uniref:Ubiquinone biosynthesis O-methyltransferase, mitochondrial n=1 Tax=Parastrongyloides trichosuri TaxID=131310 RepID=A0A0N4Z9X6_PARTI
MKRLLNFRYFSKYIDKKEIENFSKLGNVWMDEEKEFKALHSLNRLRVPAILKSTNGNLNDKNIIEVGCGGGILSFALARLGASVTGVDACKESIVASTASADRILNPEIRKRVNFIHDTIENISNTYDIVVASEVIEHVPSVEDFVNNCSRLLNKNGIIFFSTINKTLLSKIVAIELAENILNIVPQGVHDWKKFVDPNELSILLKKNNVDVTLINGVTYNPITNKWSWIDNTSVNYFLIGKKL